MSRELVKQTAHHKDVLAVNSNLERIRAILSDALFTFINVQ
jgi:hypothetical protein